MKTLTLTLLAFSLAACAPTVETAPGSSATGSGGAGGGDGTTTTETTSTGGSTATAGTGETWQCQTFRDCSLGSGCLVYPGDAGGTCWHPSALQGCKVASQCPSGETCAKLDGKGVCAP